MATPAAVAAADATIARTSRLFLDNRYVDAEGGATLEVLSPADGRPFARIAHASAADVDRAVTAARHCFDQSGWPQASPDSRAEVLRHAARELRKPERLEALAIIESRDCGKTLEESRADIGVCADLFHYYAEHAPANLVPKQLPLPAGSGGQSDFSARILHEPLGVVGCITPWNYPLMQAVVKVAPALAAGCAVVLKPSPLASLTCCALGEILAEAGAPPGALNVVTGGPPDELPDGSSSGSQLINHALLDKVSFTGSGIAGRKMLEASAVHLRPTSLELGGKSAFIIFEDAEGHLDTVIDWVMVGIFQNTGQICSATSRVIVHKDVEKVLVNRLLQAVSQIRVGDPLAEGTQMGPLVSEAQQRKVLAMLRQAESEGCVVHSTPLSLPEHLRSGFYVPPTVVTDAPTSSTVWREEIFGPVLCVKSFSTEEEAVQLANDTAYGLANAVFSTDPARRARVTARLRSGVVWENCSQAVFPSTPFGGRAGKASGFGHEYGLAGLMEYVSAKTVVGTNNPDYSWGAYISSS